MRTVQSFYDATIIREAMWESFKRLSPRHQLKNPVMFVVWLGSVLTTLACSFRHCWGKAKHLLVSFWRLRLWLWFTVLFANFAEAIAEGRGKAQAAALRGLRKTVWAKKLQEPHSTAKVHSVPSEELRKGDFVLVVGGRHYPRRRRSAGRRCLGG